MELNTNSPVHIFVYGTLKTGQVRAGCWPAQPLKIEPGWTLGTLYDTGPYPAMVDGQERVLGELWCFEACQLPLVLDVLDRIEGTNQPGEANEYNRVVLTCQSLAGQSIRAYSYLFAVKELLEKYRHLRPSTAINGVPYASWPADS